MSHLQSNVTTGSAERGIPVSRMLIWRVQPELCYWVYERIPIGPALPWPTIQDGRP